MPDYSVINTDGLTKPVTVLIEKVSNAVGTLWEPKQIRRVAQANADAAMILAKSEIEIDEVKQRAFRRFAEEQTRIQMNMESILAKSIPNVDPDAPTDDMDDDWIANFFDKSRSVSDEDMQTLWARILSGEANAPGAFSRKTVNLVADLDKASAELFRNLCGFCWQISDQSMVPLVYDLRASIYLENGLNFFDLGHLEAIGLIRIDATAGFRLMELPQRSTISYFGRSAQFEFSKKDSNELHVGQVLMTPSGDELTRIVRPSRIEGFYEFALEQWRKDGLVVQQDG